MKAIAADPHYGNVSVVQAAFATLTTLGLPEQVDLVWTSDNYHDLHNIPNVDVGAIDKAIFDALKPGGTYIVLDHTAEKGSGFRDTSTLHRSDPEAVKKEVVAAGFKFVGQSEVLRNADDQHTAKVFDPTFRARRIIHPEVPQAQVNPTPGSLAFFFSARALSPVDCGRAGRPLTPAASAGASHCATASGPRS